MFDVSLIRISKHCNDDDDADADDGTLIRWETSNSVYVECDTDWEIEAHQRETVNKSYANLNMHQHLCRQMSNSRVEDWSGSVRHGGNSFNTGNDLAYVRVVSKYFQYDRAHSCCVVASFVCFSKKCVQSKRIGSMQLWRWVGLSEVDYNVRKSSSRWCALSGQFD